MQAAAIAGITTSLWPSVSTACGRCAPLVRLDVFNAEFAGRLGLLLAPLAIIAALAWAISKIDLVK